MLKNLDPLLTPEVLYVLRAMGHGDVLTIVDRNFPADSVASTTVHGSLIRLMELIFLRLLVQYFQSFLWIVL